MRYPRNLELWMDLFSWSFMIIQESLRIRGIRYSRFPIYAVSENIPSHCIRGFKFVFTRCFIQIHGTVYFNFFFLQIVLLFKWIRQKNHQQHVQNRIGRKKLKISKYTVLKLKTIFLKNAIFYVN